MEEYHFLQEFIATRIRYIRLSKGLSQEKLSELAGLSAKYIHNVENQQFNLKVQTLERIIIALGYTPQEFFAFEQNYDEKLLHLVDNINRLSSIKREDVLQSLNQLTDCLD